MKYKNYKINPEPILFIALFFSYIGVMFSIATKNWVWLLVAFIAGCVYIYLEARRELKQMEKNKARFEKELLERLDSKEK